MTFGVREGKIAPTLLSYAPREASTRCSASWISMLRAMATRTTVGKSTARRRRVHRRNLRCVDFQGSGRLSGWRNRWMRKRRARHVRAATHRQRKKCRQPRVPGGSVVSRFLSLSMRRSGLGGSTYCGPGPSVTCAYIPGSSFSSGFGRSISTRIVRVAGSSAVAMRVTVPWTVSPAGP